MYICIYIICIYIYIHTHIHIYIYIYHTTRSFRTCDARTLAPIRRSREPGVSIVQYSTV